MIERFYNSTAYIISYNFVTDDYGQEVKTWQVSTYIKGIKQGENGQVNIQERKENVRLNETFYCNYFALNSNNRLAFSTKVNYFQQNCTSSTQMTSTAIGALYFMSNMFYRNNSTGYGIEQFKTYRINYNNNLEDIHLEIALEEDNENRT